jgi:hypothetical protein
MDKPSKNLSSLHLPMSWLVGWPLLVQVDTAELLLSDAERLAAAAVAAGDAVTLQVGEAPPPRLPESARHSRGRRGQQADWGIPACPGPLIRALPGTKRHRSCSK